MAKNVNEIWGNHAFFRRGDRVLITIAFANDTVYKYIPSSHTETHLNMVEGIKNYFHIFKRYQISTTWMCVCDVLNNQKMLVWKYQVQYIQVRLIQTFPSVMRKKCDVKKSLHLLFFFKILGKTRGINQCKSGDHHAHVDPGLRVWPCSGYLNLILCFRFKL